MTDSKHVTWACIPSLTPVPDYPVGSMLGRGRGGSKTAELRSEEMGPAGVESDASRKVSDAAASPSGKPNKDATKL